MKLLIFLIVAGIVLYKIYKRKNKNMGVKFVTKTNEALDEATDGYEFQANLWDPRTSLEALNHHRVKLRRTPENKLPDFGDGRRSHGVWLPFFDDYHHSKSPEKEELRQLEFLKKFRQTYESELSYEQKQGIILTLLNEYSDLAQASKAAHWYIWELTEIPGISEKIADVLYFEGIKSKHDVEMASDQQLLKIPGIGPGRLKQIRTHFLKERKG